MHVQALCWLQEQRQGSVLCFWTLSCSGLYCCNLRTFLLPALSLLLLIFASAIL